MLIQSTLMAHSQRHSPIHPVRFAAQTDLTSIQRSIYGAQAQELRESNVMTQFNQLDFLTLIQRHAAKNVIGPLNFIKVVFSPIFAIGWALGNSSEAKSIEQKYFPYTSKRVTKAQISKELPGLDLEPAYADLFSKSLIQESGGYLSLTDKGRMVLKNIPST